MPFNLPVPLFVTLFSRGSAWTWQAGAGVGRAHLTISTMIVIIQATAVVTNNIMAEGSSGFASTHTWVRIPAFGIYKT